MVQQFPTGPGTKLPNALASVARWERLAGVPALVAHPDWATPAPTVLWMHGRTVNKELDPGRYLRWIRAGVAAVAVDLPGHGERYDETSQQPGGSLGTIERMVGEIDAVVRTLPEIGPFDTDRLGIGGMSLGGMCALRRLCEPHPFKAASIECSTGNLGELYFGGPDGGPAWSVEHERSAVARVDPMQHLSRFEPVPMLVMHNELDEVVPIGGQQRFVEALRERYASLGADPELVRWRTFGRNGAPNEHAGFGNRSAEAKNIQTDFWVETLRPGVSPQAERAE